MTIKQKQIYMKFWGVVFVIIGLALGASTVFPLINLRSDLSTSCIILYSITILGGGMCLFALGHLTLKEQKHRKTQKRISPAKSRGSHVVGERN